MKLKCRFYLEKKHRCLISGAICAFPVSFGKEKYCDTYRFDFEKWFEDIVLELARKNSILEYYDESSCCFSRDDATDGHRNRS